MNAKRRARPFAMAAMLAMAILRRVQPGDRALAEVLEIERSPFDAFLAFERALRGFALCGGHERHRGLRAQAQLPRAVGRREPEVDFGVRGRVAPVAGQNEARSEAGLLLDHDRIKRVKRWPVWTRAIVPPRDRR